MSFHRFLLISTLAAGFASAALAADGGPATVAPTTTITRNFVFAPVTLTSTETARVIVVNTAPAPAATAANSTAPSCTGKITFIASGATPPTVSPVSFTLGAGQFAFADLPYSKSGLSTTPGEVVGQVESDVNFTSKAACTLGMSLVVFDSTTGVAHVILGNASAQGGIGPVPLADGTR
ncbi:MAG TPA: hypothetical protein VN841_03215 [Bryobacteraceae bacterium]|nr:hypothetical protein [Bryobacteraceae bacterium]